MVHAALAIWSKLIVLVYTAVTTILSSRKCPPEKIVNFLDCLRALVNHCNFDINRTVDEENKNYQPLLLRSDRKSVAR